MKLNDPRYYDWVKTISYAAPITMVIGAAGKGKTYGIRAYALKRALSKGRRFVSISRTMSERDDVKHGYFDKLALDDDFKEYEFECRRNVFLCRRDREEPWQEIGYAVALSEVQKAKGMTFVNVETLIMDEAIIERVDRFHTYLRNEWDLVSRVVNSCVREDPTDESRVQPHLYLLANAVDVLNPYFRVFGIKSEPKRGFTWHLDKLVLLHYADTNEYDDMRRDETLAGKMSKVTGYDRSSFGNAFDVDDRYIAEKPKRAKAQFGFRFEGDSYCVWCDFTDGLYYVTSKIPKISSLAVFSLTRSDDSPNLIAAKSTSKALRGVVDFYYMGAVMFDSPYTRDRFLRAMKLFGLR